MNRWAELELLCSRVAGREEFAMKLGVPILVAVKDLPEGSRGGYDTTSTLIFDPLADVNTVTRDAIIYRVEKRPDGAFQDRISVGRTRASDIQLVFPNVSKFHAYFVRDPRHGTYSLKDAGSTNGSFVNGTRLDPRASVPLQDRSEVAFAKVALRFFLPGGLYDYLVATR